MQKVIVVKFSDEEAEDNFRMVMDHIAAVAKGSISIKTDIMDDINAAVRGIEELETFDTPLEAFAEQEGPFRVEQLIENDRMGRLEDEELLREMGENASSEIEDNMIYGSSPYSSILDNDTLESIAVDMAADVLREHFDELSEHDRKVAESFLADYDSINEDE